MALVVVVSVLAGAGLLALAFFWLYVTGVRFNLRAVARRFRVAFKFWRRRE